MAIRWDHFVSQYDAARFVPSADGRDIRHVSFVREFASVVSLLQDKTNNVIALYRDISRAVEDLATCAYTADAFSELLGKVQAAIDRLNLEGYANLEQWVQRLDLKIEGILRGRVEAVLKVWCEEFERSDEGDSRALGTGKRRGEKRGGADKFVESSMALHPIVHEIRIQNQVIFLDPPIEHARGTWVQTLHDWLGMCLDVVGRCDERY